MREGPEVRRVADGAASGVRARTNRVLDPAVRTVRDGRGPRVAWSRARHHPVRTQSDPLGGEGRRPGPGARSTRGRAARLGKWAAPGRGHRAPSFPRGVVVSRRATGVCGKGGGDLDHLLGPDACFYDHFYEAQLARPNLDGLLQGIYGERSDLVVVFVSAEYDGKLWPDVEWRKIRERGATGEDREIMYVRLGEGDVTGMTRLDGYVDGRVRKSEEVARMIADRVRLGESAGRREPENGLGVERTAVGQPSVRLHLVDRDTGEGLGENVVVEDSTWFDVPSPEEIPDYRPGTPVGSGMVRVIQHEPLANSSYYRDLAEYLQTDACFRATLELENTSGSVIHDARLAIELSDPDRGYELLGSTDRPSWPERSTMAILTRVPQVVAHGAVYVWRRICSSGVDRRRTSRYTVTYTETTSSRLLLWVSTCPLRRGHVVYRSGRSRK